MPMSRRTAPTGRPCAGSSTSSRRRETRRTYQRFRVEPDAPSCLRRAAHQAPHENVREVLRVISGGLSFRAAAVLSWGAHRNNHSPRSVSMLSEQSLTTYCARFPFTPAGLAYLSNVRFSGPSRRVRGGGGNVTVRFPSKKMDRVVECESHRVELSFVYSLERDPAVLE